MPQRWRSVKGRKTEASANPEIKDAHLQKDFDFAFSSVIEPDASAARHEPAAPASPEVLRPTTSGGDQSKSKRKPDLTLRIERPNSSDSPVVVPVKHEDLQIGLAFGSPRHPPQPVDHLSELMSPGQRQQAFLLEGPLSCQPTKPKKWKIGGLFKGRASSNKEPTFYRVQPLEAADTKKLGLPIQRTPWRNPKSPAVSQDCFDDYASSIAEEKCPTDYTGPATRPPLPPSIEVSIPSTPLERYSVMFKGVNGAKQSTLLTRRSKDLESLTLTDASRSRTKDLTVPPLVRRATSPTLSKRPDVECRWHPAALVSKYSLFPATPTGHKSQAPAEFPHLGHNRSATAPAQLSHMQELFAGLSLRPSSVTPTPRASSQLEANDLEESRPSTPSAKTDGTRDSAQSEIFFAVKSFRDSHGQVGHQFEMTRPPPAAVQLARSKSNARKLDQEKLAATRHSPTSAEKRAERTTSAEIDETIAVVESLTSPSSASTVSSHYSVNQQSRESKHERNHPRKSETASVELVINTQASSTVNERRGATPRSAREMNIHVPSPVIEQAEESSPRRTQPIAPSTVQTRTSPTQMQQLMRHNAIPGSMSAAASGKSPSPSPSNYPIKDSKLIPLSKYAPKSTEEALIRQTGLRPVRPRRSHTDNLATYNTRSASLPNTRAPSRSATLSQLDHVPQPKHTLPQPIIAGPGNTKPSGPQVVAYVKPTAEVSIARTVSLSRSPSARMVGNKFPARTPSKREAAKEEVTEKKVTLGVPVVQAGHKKHRPGASIDAVLDTATIPPSSPPPMPSPRFFPPPTAPPPALPVGGQ